jgi:hypothetical protein
MIHFGKPQPIIWHFMALFTKDMTLYDVILCFLDFFGIIHACFTSLYGGVSSNPRVEKQQYFFDMLYWKLRKELTGITETIEDRTEI